MERRKYGYVNILEVLAKIGPRCTSKSSAQMTIPYILYIYIYIDDMSHVIVLLMFIYNDDEDTIIKSINLVLLLLGLP